MLPRRQRLAKSKEIKSIISNGSYIKTPYVSIYTQKDLSGADSSRAAAIVSKKVSLSAFTRHKYQRWLRENARLVIGSLDNPLDMVWIAKPSIREVKSLERLIKSISPFIANIK